MGDLPSATGATRQSPSPKGLGPDGRVSPIAPLTAIERETLTAWRDCEVGYGFGFDLAAEQCGTPRHRIRRAVRSLARKGMLEYARSLFWEDEPKMGAGYTLTDAGDDELSRYLCAECRERPGIVELDGETICQDCIDARERAKEFFAAQAIAGAPNSSDPIARSVK